MGEFNEPPGTWRGWTICIHFRRCNQRRKTIYVLHSLRENCSVAPSYCIVRVVRFACKAFKCDDCCVIRKKKVVFKSIVCFLEFMPLLIRLPFPVRWSLEGQFEDHFRFGGHLRASLTIICRPGSFAGLYRPTNMADITSWENDLEKKKCCSRLLKKRQTLQYQWSRYHFSVLDSILIKNGK